MVLKTRVSISVSAVAACLLAGCHSHTAAPTHSYPTTVTPSQARQAIQSVYNNPKMSPAQKAATINMLEGHLRIKAGPVNHSRAAP